DAGDVVHVDAGTYALLRNVVIDAQDSGVRIVGAGASLTVLTRGNTSDGSYAIEVNGADGVTVEHLGLTGGASGLVVQDGSDSDDLTLRHLDASRNRSIGVYVGPSNDRATVANSTFSGQSNGLYAQGTEALVTGNTFTANGTGASVGGARSVVA